MANLFGQKLRAICRLFFLGLLASAIVLPSAFGSNENPPEHRVSLRQLHPVEQGSSGWFAVEFAPEAANRVILRLRKEAGMGAAEFEDGSTEKSAEAGEIVGVRGIVATDFPGGLTLTAWVPGVSEPAATVFFEVIPRLQPPRIFMGGRDVTGETVEVAMGQQIALNVTLHPGLPIRSESWTLEPPGEYVGGFLHTPLQGGPQPVVLQGPATMFYWVVAGERKRVTYRVTTTDGETTEARVYFDVDGPSSAEVEVPEVDVLVGQGANLKGTYMSFGGAGLSFRARYSLPDRLVKNFTWVQLILQDTLLLKTKDGLMACSPKAQPAAEVGAGLDSGYPYGTRNPAVDNPPVELASEGKEISRKFRARMYLLWSSGLTNAIEVPLGYVGWHFAGEAARAGEASEDWRLKSGNGGVDDREHPFRQTRSYPAWNSLVPYAGVMMCEDLFEVK